MSTNINISAEYTKKIDNLLIISPEYKHVLDTQLIISPEYKHVLNTELNIMAHYVHYVNVRPIQLLTGIVAVKDMPNILRHNIKYEMEVDNVWDLNDDLSRFGGFKSSAEADADAVAKNYADYTIRKIVSDNGVVYYSYRVNQKNDFVCGILTPKVPQYGLIRGG